MKSFACPRAPRLRRTVSVFGFCLAALATGFAQSLYVHGKAAHHVQNSSAVPTIAPGADLPWSEMVGAFGFSETDLSAGTFTRPGGSPLALQWSDDDGEWSLGSELRFATQAELDAAVPDSATPYVFALTLSGAGAASSGPLVLNGGLFPNAPHVLNYDAAQEINASEAFTLSWSAFTGGTASDAILVFVQTNQGQAFGTPLPGQPGALPGTATSVEIPAGTLVAGTEYRCEILFLKIVEQRTGDIAGATGLSMYQAATELSLVAATPPPPEFYLLGKTVSYQQATAGAPTVDPEAPWSTILVAIGFDEDDFSAVTVQRPGLANVPLSWDEGMWEPSSEDEFATQGEIDAEFPDSASAYAFAFTPGGGGSVINSPLVLNGAAYPAAPRVSNYAAAQAIDPEQPFTLTWDAFAGGTASDAILIFVRGADSDVFSSPFPGAEGALDGTATSVQIPAGTFQPGRTYECEVLFLNIVDQRDSDVPGATGYAAYAATTEFGLATTGTAVGPLATEMFLEFTHTQGDIVAGTVQVTYPLSTYYNPFFVAFQDPNPPDGVTFFGPAGSQLEAGVPSTQTFSWGNDGQSYMTAPITTGPAGTNYPPDGMYSVNYGLGSPYEFHLTDPQAAARQVVVQPVLTINGAGQLTAVGWTYHHLDGTAAAVPSSYLEAQLNIGFMGGNAFLQVAPGGAAVTLDTPVLWSSVSWIDIAHVDDLRHRYRSSYRVLHPVAPTIINGPFTQSVTAGGNVQLMVAANGIPAPTYQWQLDGVDIAGATSATYTLPSAQQFHAGSYRVVVTNSVSSVISGSATLTVNAAPSSNSRLVNLSTRALCLTGDNVLIPGFVIQGPGNKQLLIRAVGPTLGTLGVAGTLPDPQLTLKRWNPAVLPNGAYEDVETNADWGTNSNVASIISMSASLGAFPLDGDSADAALLVDLAPGQYSVVARDAGAGTGISMVELYDADAPGGTSRLINISNRGYVGAGDSIMIPGFVVSSGGPKTLLVRAVGPTLGGYGVPDVLADPTLAIYQHDFQNNTDTLILSNDNWGTGPGAAQTLQVAQQVSAFPLIDGSTDAAFVVTLNPGVYTVHARGAGSGTGVALVEVYVVP